MPQPPLNAIEIELCRIWQSILRRHVMDIDVHFFLDAGGDSRAGVRLIVEIRRVFGVELKLAEVLSAPTVRMLADRLVSEGAKRNSGPVVRLRKGEDATPLYVFHALPGTLVRYFEFTRAMGPRHTIWGLESLGIEQETSPLDSIEDMADEYVSHMLAEHPGGGWRLLGYSMGGYLAVEAARRLRDRGEDVEFVCALDSRLPTMDKEPDFPAVKTKMVRRLARTILDLDVPAEALEGRTHERQLEEVIKRGRETGALANDYHVGRFLRFVDVRIHNYVAIVNYRPRSRYPGPMTLIRAAGMPTYEDDGCHGWSEAVGSVEVFDTPGGHVSMMEPPAVARLAQIVQGQLA